MYHTNTETKETMLSQWDSQLDEMLEKTPFSTVPPVIPDEIKFPFMMVFHRNKISERNNNYLVAVAIMNISDMAITKRNLKHKGWPNMTLMFDLPEWMIPDHEATRYEHWRFDNWRQIEKFLSESDRLLIPDLEELFPCPATQVKDKKGQYRLIF